MMKVCFHICVFLFFLFHLSHGSILNVIRQDANDTAFIELYDSSQGGIVQGSSNVPPFPFSWPLIQMTSNTKDQQIYIVTYPDTAPGAVLYLLNKQLQVQYIWDKVTFSYFDLQYSNTQNTLYGIYVSSTYGRVLSNFTVNQAAGTIDVDQLFTLPYMWYVNASSFHHPTAHYYALINYFPGHPESTLDQQLVVADFSQDSKVKEPQVNVLLITNTNGVILQFLAFADVTKQLYFAGLTKDSKTVIVGILNTATGEVKDIIWSLPASSVGPLVADDVQKSLSVFVKDPTGKKWQLWTLSLKPSSLQTVKAQLVKEYAVNDDLAYFAASSIGFA